MQEFSISINTQTHTHTHTYMCIYLNAYIYVYVCMYIFKCIYIYTRWVPARTPSSNHFIIRVFVFTNRNRVINYVSYFTKHRVDFYTNVLLLFLS